MNHSLRPRKKRRNWLPLLCGLIFVVGGALLWRAELNSPRLLPPAPAKAAPKEAPPPATPAPTADKPQTGKSRQPIFDRNMATLAVSFKQASVYLRPLELQKGQEAVEHLAGPLGLSAEKIQDDMQTARSFIWLKRNLSTETARKISEFHYSGVYLVDEVQRYYPFHDHAAQVVGFVKDELGLAGAEFIYDSLLIGDHALAPEYLNLPGLDPGDIPTAGAAAVLSIDMDLQVILEKKLQNLLQQTAAKSARAVLIETGNGEILAMAELPAYNPNVYWKASNSAHKNRVLSEPVPMAGLNAFIKVAAELATGNVPPELATREEEAERIISPRLMKIAKGDAPVPNILESQVWQPGIHLSPPFQWTLGFTQKNEALSAFCVQLGLGAIGSGLADNRSEAGADPSDKNTSCAIEDEAWRTSALNILAAFSQLTNGGKAVSPHLLRGIWTREESAFHPTAYPATEAIGPQASADFIRYVKGLMPPGPGDDLIIESIRALSKQPVKDQLGLLESQEASAVGDSMRFSSVTLGVSRQGEHQLALIMMADDARLNLAFPSPLRRVAAEIVNQGQALMSKRWSNEIKAPQMESNALLCQKWSLAQSLDEPRAAIDSLVNLDMPDVVGMSLRKAMQALQGYNLQINVQGAGRVAQQSPAPGVSLKGIKEAKLELQMNH